MKSSATKVQRRFDREDRASATAALRLLLDDPDGRVFLWNFLGLANTFATPFEPNALKMAFNCGAQSLGLQVQEMLAAVSPTAYADMTMEMTDVRNRRDRELADAHRADARDFDGVDDSE